MSEFLENIYHLHFHSPIPYSYSLFNPVQSSFTHHPKPHSTKFIHLRIPSTLHFDKSSTLSSSHLYFLSAAFVSIDHSFEMHVSFSFKNPTILILLLTHLSLFSSLLNLFPIIIHTLYHWRVTGLWA